ncbi:nucleotidyltransferase family protein [Planctomycetota bacterium]
MIRLIEDNREAIDHLCTRYRVRRLEVFGSSLTDKNFHSEQSDLDFLVEFLPLKQGEYADAYFGLLEALEELFGRHVDLVMPGAIKNPYFLESVNRNRMVLYAA